MMDAVPPPDDSRALSGMEIPPALGALANQAAGRFAFTDYQQRRAAHTLRRQRADLLLLADFLHSLGVQPGDLFTQAEAWRGFTWGLAAAWVQWMLQSGYALSSVNVRLSTLKTYARLALQAGTLPPQEYALIRAVQGYSRREQPRLDARRAQVRRGGKKSAALLLSLAQVRQLKAQPATPQGRRDALLICLLLDHGLRAGEAALLRREDVDLAEGMLHFYRPKVGKVQMHRLSGDTRRALQACAQADELPLSGALLRRSLRGGKLGRPGLTPRAISARVCRLGKDCGAPGLSAHDCRHTWATLAARRGVNPFHLQEAGGWSSLAMPRRYVEDSRIANEGFGGEA